MNSFLLKYPREILLILVLGFAAHMWMISPAFKTMDDQFSIVVNEDIRHFSNIPKIFTSSYFGGDDAYYRPFVIFTYLLEYQAFGLKAQGYYVMNILIHIFSALFVFRIISILTKSSRIGFLTGLLFVLHPIHWEAVSNISGRAILLASLCYLGAFLYFLKGRMAHQKGALIVSLIFFTVGLFCKESTFAFPILIGAYVFLVEKKNPLREWKSFAQTLWPYFTLLGAFLIWRKYLGITKLFFWRSFEESILGFLSFLRSVIDHLRYLIIPTDFHFDRSSRLFISFTDPELILTSAFIIVLALLIFSQRQRLNGLFLFFIAWFCIDLLPVSQILVTIGVSPGYISAADHFLYTACIGIFALMVISGEWIYQKILSQTRVSAKTLRMAIGGLFLFLFIMTVQQNVYARHELSMLRQSLQRSPHNTRIRTAYAFSLAHVHLPEAAEGHLRMVLEQYPMNPLERLGLGKVLNDQGRHWEAVQELDKMIYVEQLEPIRKENYERALNALIPKYEERLKQEPNNAQIYYSLGVVYAKQQKMSEAAAQYEKALALNPRYKNVLFNLASIYKIEGKLDQAKDLFERMIALEDPKDEIDESAHRHLFDIYSQMNDPHKAQEHAQMADELRLNREK